MKMSEIIGAPDLETLEEGFGSTVRNAAIGALGLGAAAMPFMDRGTPAQEPAQSVQQTVPTKAEAPNTKAETPAAPKAEAPVVQKAQPADKQAFIARVKPVVQKANAEIADTRAKINRALQSKKPTRAEREFLEDMYEKYKVEAGDARELLLRVDMIPESLVIAQSALESGWGQSRLAQQGNAMFGQKTRGAFAITAKDDGTGDLAGGKEIKYARFIDPLESISSYMRNLNTNAAYDDFRTARAQLRKKGKPTGLELVKHLKNYSNERGDYVKKVSSIIVANVLEAKMPIG